MAKKRKKAKLLPKQYRAVESRPSPNSSDKIDGWEIYDESVAWGSVVKATPLSEIRMLQPSKPKTIDCDNLYIAFTRKQINAIAEGLGMRPPYPEEDASAEAAKIDPQAAILTELKAEISANNSWKTVVDDILSDLQTGVEQQRLFNAEMMETFQDCFQRFMDIGNRFILERNNLNAELSQRGFMHPVAIFTEQCEGGRRLWRRKGELFPEEVEYLQFECLPNPRYAFSGNKDSFSVFRSDEEMRQALHIWAATGFK